MLVLGRKENESIIIGNNIRVTIVGRCGSSIRVGVQAPSDVRIVREELTGRRPIPGGDSASSEKAAEANSLDRTDLERKHDDGSEGVPISPACQNTLAQLTSLSMPTSGPADSYVI